MRGLRILALAFGAISATVAGAEPQQPLLTVIVLDHVGIGGDAVRKAAQVAQDILRKAGIPRNGLRAPSPNRAAFSTPTARPLSASQTCSSQLCRNRRLIFECRTTRWAWLYQAGRESKAAMPTFSTTACGRRPISAIAGSFAFSGMSWLTRWGICWASGTRRRESCVRIGTVER